MKLVELVAVPPAVVTVTGPVVAPAGTVVTICVAVFDVIVALTPLNFTEVAPIRFVPPDVAQNSNLTSSRAALASAVPRRRAMARITSAAIVIAVRDITSMTVATAFSDGFRPVRPVP